MNLVSTKINTASEVFVVPTSSITKQFVVKDPEAFKKLMVESAKIPKRTDAQDSPSLNKG